MAQVVRMYVHMTQDEVDLYYPQAISGIRKDKDGLYILLPVEDFDN